jgi:hypothetical protein
MHSIGTENAEIVTDTVSVFVQAEGAILSFHCAARTLLLFYGCVSVKLTCSCWLPLVAVTVSG